LLFISGIQTPVISGEGLATPSGMTSVGGISAAGGETPEQLGNYYHNFFNKLG